MKIILLSGKPNSGKSTSLNLLYEKITGKKSGSFDFDEKLDKKYKNKSVAITTSGDVYQCCVEAIVKYADCDVLVLAYSDKFARSLTNIVKRYPHHCIVKKTRANDSDNERACNEILKNI